MSCPWGLLKQKINCHDKRCSCFLAMVHNFKDFIKRFPIQKYQINAKF